MTLKEFMEKVENQNEFEREYLNSEDDDVMNYVEQNAYYVESHFGLTYNGGKVENARQFEVKCGSVSDLAKIKI